jgi:hypothetical protein
MTAINKTPFVDKLRKYLNSDNLLSQIQELLGKHNAVIAGGSVLSGYRKNFNINDIDIYINKNNAVAFWIDFCKIFPKANENQGRYHLRKAYEQSFFKKNHIIGRISGIEARPLELSNKPGKISYDVILVENNEDISDVISNFDLSFCEIWYNVELKNGKIEDHVYANYPKQIIPNYLRKVEPGVLQSDYLKVLVENNNKFIKFRLIKYLSRGFTIIIPKTEIVNKSADNKIKYIKNKDTRKSELIIPANRYFLKSAELTAPIITNKEEWIVTILLNSIIKTYNYPVHTYAIFSPTNILIRGEISKRPNIPGIIYIDLEKPTIDNLFKYLIYNNSHFGSEYENRVIKRNITDPNFQEIYAYFMNKLHLTLTRISLAWSTNIGERESVSYSYEPTNYHVPLTKFFVKHSQFKPLPWYGINPPEGFKNNEELSKIIKSSNPGMIFACPRGHLHSADNCGIPTEVNVCGYPMDNNSNCELIIGGYQHILVPGNYAVYIKSVSSNYHFIYYGNFPIRSNIENLSDYDLYLKLLEQANVVNRGLGFPDIPTIAEKPVPAAIPLDKDIILRSDVNTECPIYGTPFDIIERKYVGNPEDPGEYPYILLECGHLISKEGIYALRGNKPENEWPEVKCPIVKCGKYYKFGNTQCAIRKMVSYNIKSNTSDNVSFINDRALIDLHKRAADNNIYVLAMKNNKFLINEFKLRNKTTNVPEWMEKSKNSIIKNIKNTKNVKDLTSKDVYNDIISEYNELKGLYPNIAPINTTELIKTVVINDVKKTNTFSGKWVSMPTLTKMIETRKDLIPNQPGLKSFFKLTTFELDVKDNMVLFKPLNEIDFGYYKQSKKLGYV